MKLGHGERLFRRDSLHERVGHGDHTSSSASVSRIALGGLGAILGRGLEVQHPKTRTPACPKRAGAVVAAAERGLVSV